MVDFILRLFGTNKQHLFEDKLYLGELLLIGVCIFIGMFCLILFMVADLEYLKEILQVSRVVTVTCYAFVIAIAWTENKFICKWSRNES